MRAEYSKVEIFHDDEWVTINFWELRKGDLFRMVDDLDPVKEEEYIACYYPYPIHDSWTIECEPANKKYV